MENIAFKIQNFHKIKYAQVNLNGLSVIGGKNNEGKSTVGKLLMALLKTDNRARAGNAKSTLEQRFRNYINLLFDKALPTEFMAELLIDDHRTLCAMSDGQNLNFKPSQEMRAFLDCTLIQTPIVWDLQDFFLAIAKNQQNQDSWLSDEKIPYPYALYELYLKLTSKRLQIEVDPKISKISQAISQTVGGKLIRDLQNPEKICFFDSQTSKEIPLLSTASGIKVFGIIQNLINNAYVTPQGYFIFDEPENHLHPTWQVEFAKIIIELIKNNICIMVNTHSPYLLEALQKLEEREKTQKVHFYLAEDGNVSQVNGNNDETLERVFSSLNESFAKIDEIDIERIRQNGRPQ